MQDGLKDKHRQRVIDILAESPRVDRAVLFGSRAMGTFTPQSDVDIALFGKDLSLHDLGALSREMEESSIPQKIDLLLHDQIKSPKLRRHIKQHGKVLFERDTSRAGMANDGWTPTTLGNEVDLLTGFPFKSDRYTDDASEIKLLRGDNVVQGRLRWENVKRWPADETVGLDQYRLDADDVVLAMDRPWIKAGLKYAAISQGDLPVLLVQRVARLRGGPTLDTRYLRYLISSSRFTQHVLAVQTGTAVPHISGGQIREFEFYRPPIPVQQGIAYVLGTLDDKIELNRRMNRTLEKMAAAIFKSWFIDFDPVQAKAEGRDPNLPAEIADLFPDAFEDSDLGPIPKGWDVKPLTDAIAINPKRTLSKGSLAPYLEMSNMPTRGPSPDSWRVREITSGTKFINGDTLLARITPCLENGKTAFVDFLHDGEVGWGSTEYIVLRPDIGIPPVFAYLLARTPTFRTFAIRQMTGSSGRQRVPPGSLSKFPIALPETDSPVYRAFGEEILPLFDRINLAVRQNRRLAGLRDSLLPRLLSGEIEPPEAEAIANEVV